VILPNIASTHCIQELIRRAVDEDLGPGDVTSESLVGENDRIAGCIRSRGDYILAGGPVAEAVFRHLDPELDVVVDVRDGGALSRGAVVLTVRGNARAVLAAERTALNFLQRLTGVASLTHRFVEKAKPRGVEVLDTRKTTPGMRILEKYAVRCGGGRNHRMGLYDRLLIKDNHIALWRLGRGNGLASAVRTARRKYPGLSLEVEVERREDLEEVLDARPDWVLLDNMDVGEMKQCVERCRGVCKVEASGGISLERLDGILETGIDAVSVGALTHSAEAADLTLDIEVAGSR